METTVDEHADELLADQLAASSLQRRVMPHFTVEVLHDEGPRPRIWKVAASTEDDAIQLAFALDGGWSRTERNATDMLELAKAYCSVRHNADFRRGDLNQSNQPQSDPPSPARNG